MTRNAPPSSPLHWQAQEALALAVALGAVQDVVHLRRRWLQHIEGKPHAMTPCLFRGVFLAGGNMAATGPVFCQTSAPLRRMFRPCPRWQDKP